MIILDFVEKHMELFNKNPNNFMVFYRTYGLALQYQKHKLGIPIDEEREKQTKKALQIYYWGALNEALLWTPRKLEESNKEWNNRVRKKYFELRKKAFLFLQQRAREDYKLILELLSVTTELRKTTVIKGLDTNRTWMVKSLYGEY